MAVWRFKVTLRTRDEEAHVRVVMPVHVSEEMTVGGLSFAIETRLNDYGVTEDSEVLRLGRLETTGGYVLEASDKIIEVLRDSEEVVAVSHGAWLVSELPLCEKILATIAEEDFVEDKHYFVCVGQTTRKKLFAAAGEGRELRRGTVKHYVHVGSEDRALVADGERLGAKREGGRLLLWNKPTHAKRATEYAVDIETHEVTVLNDPGAEPPRDSPAFPPSEREGETLPEPERDEDTRAPPGEDEIVATGDPDVVVSQHHKINTELYQVVSSAGTLTQYVYCNLRIFNKRAAEYQVADVKTTLDGASVHLADRQGMCAYRFRENRTFAVEARAHKAVSVVLAVEIPGVVKVWEAERRLHQSLPDPLVVDISLVQYDGSEHVIRLAPIASPPLALPTPRNVLKAVDCPDLVGFAYCDDTQAMARLAVAIGLSKDGKFFKVTRMPNRGLSFGGQHYLKPPLLAKLAYQAGDRPEIDIPDLSYTDTRPIAGTRSAVVAALVHDGQVYALKVTLQTNTGKTVDYFKLPALKR